VSCLTQRERTLIARSQVAAVVCSDANEVVLLFLHLDCERASRDCTERGLRRIGLITFGPDGLELERNGELSFELENALLAARGTFLSALGAAEKSLKSFNGTCG
jgi:hypothetical protein